MPVELRKRKEPTQPAPPPPSKKQNPVKAALNKAKDSITGHHDKPAEASTSNARSSSTSSAAATGKAATAGSTVALDAFGGEVETNDGTKTTLKQLVDESGAGVVLFTYPKASTPGCTTQACLFRDDYTPLTATGFAIYGLSRDSPKANTTFKTKQKLPYPLLCDPAGTLIAAIGMKKSATQTTRGVFVVDKHGKVLAAEPGGPAATVAVVKKLVVAGGSAPVPVTQETAARDEAVSKFSGEDVHTAPAADGKNASSATATDENHSNNHHRKTAGEAAVSEPDPLASTNPPLDMVINDAPPAASAPAPEEEEAAKKEDVAGANGTAV